MSNPTITAAPSRPPAPDADCAELLGRVPLRLHLGCGEVYLRGWVNVDAVGELASENPRLADNKATDLADYYKRPYHQELLGHDKWGRNVVDLRACVTSLPMIPDDSVHEILCVNLIDHLRFSELPAAVREWRRILRPDGQLVIDVGDAKGNAQLITAATTIPELEWGLRLTYCHSRDRYDTHHWGYTPDYLELLMGQWGFAQLWTRRDYIDHAYPAFQSAFIKPRPRRPVVVPVTSTELTTRMEATE